MDRHVGEMRSFTIYVYIYVYIYMYIYVYIYMYTVCIYYIIIHIHIDVSDMYMFACSLPILCQNSILDFQVSDHPSGFPKSLFVKVKSNPVFLMLKLA